LDEALVAHEIGVEGGTKRVAAPGDAGDPAALPAQQSVVEGDAEWRLVRQAAEHPGGDAGKDAGGVKALLGKEPESDASVLEGLAGGGQQTGDGVASQAEQAAQGQRRAAVCYARLGSGSGALAPDLLEVVEEPRRRFLRTEGGALGRRRTRVALSSTSHSTVSARANSMAWATAEGKLMYHCALV
jgi:hypothetical protein